MSSHKFINSTFLDIFYILIIFVGCEGTFAHDLVEQLSEFSTSKVDQLEGRTKWALLVIGSSG